jgi:hypothetical protein
LLPRSRLLLRALLLRLFPNLLGPLLRLLLDALLLLLLRLLSTLGLFLLLLLRLLSTLRLLLGLTILLLCWASLLLPGLRSAVCRRCAFLLPALRPIGLAPLLSLLLALSVVLRVHGYHRSEKQEGGGRAGSFHESHGDSPLVV